MTILGHNEIIRAMQQPDIADRLYISPLLNCTQVKEASVDVRLGNDFFTTKHGNIGVLDPAEPSTRPDRLRHRHRLNQYEKFFLHPNEVVLASTLEYFRLPARIAASVTSRSRWGRLGLIIATATAIHPGFKGAITLELVNHGRVPLVLYPGLLVAQVVFFRTDGANEYLGDLAGRTDVHAADFSLGWQSDMSFWCS